MSTAFVRFNGAERIVRTLSGRGTGQSIEEGAFAHVGQADDSGFHESNPVEEDLAVKRGKAEAAWVTEPGFPKGAEFSRLRADLHRAKTAFPLNFSRMPRFLAVPDTKRP